MESVVRLNVELAQGTLNSKNFSTFHDERIIQLNTFVCLELHEDVSKSVAGCEVVQGDGVSRIPLDHNTLDE